MTITTERRTFTRRNATPAQIAAGAQPWAGDWVERSEGDRRVQDRKYRDAVARSDRDRSEGRTR